MERKIKVQIFDSLEDENRAERARQASMSPEERLRELAVLQERHWGEQWSKVPLVRKASWERLSWL